MLCFINKKYKSLSDNALIGIIISGDKLALNALIEKYKGHARSLSKTIKDTTFKRNCGFAFEDIYIVALNAVMIAIQNFHPEKGSFFFSYWKEVATREVYKFIQANSYYGDARVFGLSISLDEIIGDDENSATYGEVLASKDYYSHQDINLDDTSYQISEIASKEFTSLERQILYLHIIGYLPKEIAKKLNIDIESVYKAIRRVKRVIKKKLNK